MACLINRLSRATKAAGIIGQSSLLRTQITLTYTLCPNHFLWLFGSFETWFLTLAHESWENLDGGWIHSVAEMRQNKRRKCLSCQHSPTTALSHQGRVKRQRQCLSDELFWIRTSLWGKPFILPTVLEHKQSTKQFKDEEEPSWEELEKKKKALLIPCHGAVSSVTTENDSVCQDQRCVVALFLTQCLITG